MRDKIIGILRRIIVALKPPRALRVTRLGTYVLLLTVGIGLAGMNTGNNLLYMVFGMMLGFITASGVISEMSLRETDVEWIFPAELYAGTETTVRMVLKNYKPKFPALGVRVSARCVETTSGRSFDISAGFIFTAELANSFADVRVTPPKRGKYRLTRVKIETEFPFGFFSKYAVYEAGEKFTVYPKMSREWSFGRILRRGERDVPLAVKGQGGSFWGMREFAHGDNPRSIAWKSSARQGRLMMRETEQESENKIWLDMGVARDWMELSDEQIDSALSCGVSFLEWMFHQGYAVGLAFENKTYRPAANRYQLRDIYEFMARFDAKALDRKSGSGKFVTGETVNLISLWNGKN